jgi:23S rRNA pseudouridine1911/1915/1917 synthase
MVSPSPGPLPQTSRIHQVQVTVAGAGVRVDQFLASAGLGLTRARVQALVEAGHVAVDGRVAKASLRLRGGEVVVAVEPPARGPELRAQDLPLHVLFQDADLLVVNKAAGVVVHPAAGNPDGTLVNALLHHVPDLGPIGGTVRPGLVHRLDKDTSGVLVVAKSDGVLHALQAQFRAGEVEKRYLALHRGVLVPVTGTWETPYGRHPRARLKFTSKIGSRRAVTDYSSLGVVGQHGVVALRLHTGRTHQIRVHLADQGCPLVGDALYGGRGACVLPDGVPVGRQMLHATVLGLRHPGSGRAMRWVLPPPGDFMEVAHRLGLEALVSAWVEGQRAATAPRTRTSAPPPAPPGPRSGRGRAPR